MKHTAARLAASLFIVLGLAACGAQGVDGKMIEAAENNADWLSYGRTYSEHRFSPLDDVNVQTIGNLGVAWWAEFDTDRGQEATPLVYDGVLYTTTAWSKVYAFNAKTGEKLWSYDPQVDGQAAFYACCDVVNRGLAMWQGKLYLGALDGRLISIDAKTGKPDWEVQTTDKEWPYTITGAPRVVNGKVLIGNGGADKGVRGYLSAYDAKTGKMIWRFYTTPNPEGKPDGAASDAVMKAKASATWFDGVWKESGGGGTVWDSIVYDPKTGLIYAGVGNGSPWAHRLRSGGKGDNLFLASIIALKPDTGEYVWHYQTTPGETWDYTAVQHIMTADLMIDGKERHVIMQAPKNGFFYVLDAVTGELLSAEKYVPNVDWAEKVDLKTGRPVEAAWARYDNGGTSRQIPGALGTHNWQPMAFNPKENLVYIPSQIANGNYTEAVDYKFLRGASNTGMLRVADGPSTKRTSAFEGPITRSGRLVAWDPSAKAVKWSVDFPNSWTSGVLATAGNLVFHAAGPDLYAYDAATGQRLWTYNVGHNIIAPAMTYAIDGEQYIAVMVGYGGAGATSGNVARRPGRILVFKLGGAAQVTPYSEPVVQPRLDISAAEAATGDADRGAMPFRQFCGSCHAGGGFLPILPRSPAILSKAGFDAIVLDGAMTKTGMVSFKRYLTPEQVEDIRAYLLWRAETDPVAPAPQGAVVKAAASSGAHAQ